MEYSPTRLCMGGGGDGGVPLGVKTELNYVVLKQVGSQSH